MENLGENNLQEFWRFENGIERLDEASWMNNDWRMAEDRGGDTYVQYGWSDTRRFCERKNYFTFTCLQPTILTIQRARYEMERMAWNRKIVRAPLFNNGSGITRLLVYWNNRYKIM